MINQDRIAKLAIKAAEKKWKHVLPHVGPDIRDALYMAEAAAIVASQDEEKYDPATAVIMGVVTHLYDMDK